MYKIIISPHANRELKRIEKIYERAISEAIKDIGEDPFLGKPLTREFTGKFSYRVGLFRIIYKVNTEDKIVNIISAGHRSTIYDKLY